MVALPPSLNPFFSFSNLEQPIRVGELISTLQRRDFKSKTRSKEDLSLCINPSFRLGLRLDLMASNGLNRNNDSTNKSKLQIRLQKQLTRSKQNKRKSK